VFVLNCIHFYPDIIEYCYLKWICIQANQQGDHNIQESCSDIILCYKDDNLGLAQIIYIWRKSKYTRDATLSINIKSYTVTCLLFIFNSQAHLTCVQFHEMKFSDSCYL
jgi:hypothetical protein